ncbi:MAG: hypothetical protein GY940_35040, partial [bacterium]|nr:hypothetical protein [bacterium]
MQYDGVSWRLLTIPNSHTLSLAMDDDSGTIYIGGNSEIGFLTFDKKRALEYRSLTDHLKENEKNFSMVWETFSTTEGVY